MMFHPIHVFIILALLLKVIPAFVLRAAVSKRPIMANFDETIEVFGTGTPYTVTNFRVNKFAQELC